MIPVKKVIDSEFVIVGGGIAGLSAAIAAGEAGVKATLLEKADTRRSGSGCGGNDHFFCYLPEVHGPDIRRILREMMLSMVGDRMDGDLALFFLEKSGEMVRRWHEWGINMKPYGGFEFRGHAFPGRPRIWLKYDGHNQKAVLNGKARELGTEVMNHHSVLDVAVSGGRVAGVLALDTSRDEPSFTLVRSPNVLLATGMTTRLYNSTVTPGYLFNSTSCPACVGSGIAHALRAGARLVNMELNGGHVGPAYFTRSGKATWIGVYKFPDGTPMGPFVTVPTRDCGDITADLWSGAFSESRRNGRGPIYIDCSQIAEEDYECMMRDFVSEGLTSLRAYMDRHGLDLRRHAVEFVEYECGLLGQGPEIDKRAETTVPGLYAAGDLMGNVRGEVAAASVFGWECGKAVASGERAAPAGDIASLETVRRSMEFYSSLYERRNGAPWKEANVALAQIMTDYIPVGDGRKRSGTMMTAGLNYLRDLRERCTAEIKAANAHELMRAAEVCELLDIGETIARCALERRETRYNHIRTDFPFPDPKYMDSFLTAARVDGGFVFGLRERRQA